MPYTSEKLSLAIHTLCSEGSLKERLISCTRESLIQLYPKNSLSLENKKRFEELYNKLTSVEAIDTEGRIAATINTLDELQMIRIVDEIISIYSDHIRG